MFRVQDVCASLNFVFFSAFYFSYLVLCMVPFHLLLCLILCFASFVYVLPSPTLSGEQYRCGGTLPVRSGGVLSEVRLALALIMLIIYWTLGNNHICRGGEELIPCIISILRIY